MRNGRWYYYEYSFQEQHRKGNGNGMARFKKTPNVFDWMKIARNIEKHNNFVENSIIIGFYKKIV